MNGTNNTQSTVSASSTLPGQTSGYTTRVTAKQAFGRAVQTASVSTSLTLPLKMQSTEKRFIAERSIAVVSGPQIRLLRPSVTPSSSSLSSPPASPPAPVHPPVHPQSNRKARHSWLLHKPLFSDDHQPQKPPPDTDRTCFYGLMAKSTLFAASPLSKLPPQSANAALGLLPKTC